MPPVPPTMRAAVMSHPGGPEVLQVQRIPIPKPKDNEVLIRIRAAGLNRSEMFTRRGDSGPAVPLPRVLGIECIGTVAALGSGSSSSFKEGDVVATAMGGIGRAFDGGYAEYTCVPSANVLKLASDLPTTIPGGWATIGAVPEMMQTAYGSLRFSLNLQRGETLLIRGGTTSVGLAAASLAKSPLFGAARVIATTRRLSSEKESLLKSSGVDDVVADTGDIASSVHSLTSNSSSTSHQRPLTSSGNNSGVDKVLELIGLASLPDSLHCVRATKPGVPAGIVCITGIAGNKWNFDPGTNPMELIPSGVLLTVYNGGTDRVLDTPYGDILELVTKGEVKVLVGKTFDLATDDEAAVKAHRILEGEKGAGDMGGKGVLLM